MSEIHPSAYDSRIETRWLRILTLFMIAAINDTDSGNKSVPLAPSKEAQECLLIEKYHEGLEKINKEEYTRARELLEEAIEDPLISNIQDDDNGVDPHLRELRFLYLKNLADVFLKLGPDHNQSAMKCFLQAAELDCNHVVVWNQLGTLSCSMGSLSTARWAFEQGLRVSPTNSICMEKLMEVLIAIGDEVPCLAVSRCLLEKYPDHPRALHVKNTIEGIEVGPHGFDQLEPKHPRLKSKKKPDVPTNPVIRQDMNVQVTEATWLALVEKTVAILTTIDVHSYHRVIVRLVSSTSTETEYINVKAMDNPCINDIDSSASDKEQQSYERSSSRLEWVRRQKTGKYRSESGKDADTIFQDLEQFVLKQTDSNKEIDCSSSSYQFPDASLYTPELEACDVQQFLETIPEDCNVCKLVCLLLEEISDLEIPFGEYFNKLPELERLTRHWCQDRSPRCHMYLAEICFDLGSLPGNEMRREEFLSHSNYHICLIMADVSKEEDSQDFWSFWARFYWIFGCLCLSEGNKERACGNFNSAFYYLKKPIFLPNCKYEKWLTDRRITCELYSIQFTDNNKARTIDPLPYSSKDVRMDPEAVVQEVSALDLLTACEKEEDLNLEVHLDSHKQKLQLLAVMAGMDKAAPGSENVEILKLDQVERIVGVVRDISKNTGPFKSSTGKNYSTVGQEVFTSLLGTIAETQSLLLSVMHNSLRSILAKRAFTNISDDPEQIESTCLVEAAISFCKLQHLGPSITIKAQVELIVMVHDLLADFGLCCAGKDYKGEEGPFLKFAINHLLTLDAKLKSLHSTEGIDEAASSDDQTKDDFEESSIHSALSQSIFCLYGLTMYPVSTNHGLFIHENTGRGNYNTKEHCADVFQYILAYAKGCRIFYPYH